MNKKIIFLILILLSIIIDVKAIDNVLQIDGKNYVLNKDINEKNYSYTVSNNTLILNNYKGRHIYKEGTLNVIVKGDNYFFADNGLFLIRADDLTVSGDGTLNFDVNNAAFSALKVSISDVTIRGSSTRELILCSNELNINNVDIDFEANGTFIVGKNIININNSIINGSSIWGFRHNDNGIITINNSDINMECSVTCLSATAKMTFNETNAYFHGITSASSNMELYFKNTSFVISEDGINYRKSVDYNGYPYLKTVRNVINDDVNQDDNKDNTNQDNNSGNNQIDDNSSSLDKDNDSSNSKNENELNKDNSNKGNESGDDSDTPNLDTDLDGSQGKNDKENDDILDDTKNDIDDKTQNNNDSSDSSSSNSDDNLKDNDSNDDIQGDKDNVNNGDLKDNIEDESKDDIYTESEYENNDKTYTKNEYDKDDSLTIVNPKTYDGILNSISILILSLLIIIASIIIIKRNVNGKI